MTMTVTGDFINEASATLNLGARTSSVTGSFDNSGSVNINGTDLTVGGLVLRAGSLDDPLRSGSITSLSHTTCVPVQ